MDPILPPPGSPRVWRWALLLALVSVAVFSAVWRAEFVGWENTVNICANPHVQGLTAANVRWAFTDATYVPRYMPLGWLSYAASSQVSGLNPVAHHAGNLLLHALNTVLVFFLARRLLGLAAARGGTMGPDGTKAPAAGTRVAWGAAAATLLWALHPLRVETVALASARIYCQAAALALGCVLAWFRALEAPPRSGGRHGWMALSVLAYVASLLTYPIALTLPAALLVIDALLLGRFAGGVVRGGGAKVWLEKAPYALAATAVAGVTLWLASHTEQWQQLPGTQFGLRERVAQAFYVTGYYPWKHLLPVPLTHVYPTLIDFNPVSWPFVASALGVTGVSAWLFLRRRQWPAAAALGAAYLVLIAPFSGLTQHPHHPYDRYSYLVGILWALAVVGLAGGLIRAGRRPQTVGLAGLACVVAFSCMTLRQVGVWHNTISLYEHLLTHYPARPDRAKYDIVLGRAYESRAAQDDFSAARRCYESAVRLAPDLPEARMHLAELLVHEGQPKAAIPHYQEVLRTVPDHVTARRNLGATFGTLGRYEEALAEFEAARRLEPDNPAVHRNLAITYRQRGQTNQALQAWAEAARLEAAGRRP